MITDLKAAMAAKIPKEQVRAAGASQAHAGCRGWCERAAATRPAPVALPSTQPSPDALSVPATQLQERLRDLRKECGPKALGACTVEQARSCSLAC